jgi:hypothetical protein
LQLLLARVAEQQQIASVLFTIAWDSYPSNDRQGLLNVTTELRDTIPSSVQQNITNVTALYEQGKQAAPEMLKAMANATFSAGGLLSLPPPALLQTSSDTFDVLTDTELKSTIKGFARVQEKTNDNYDGDASKILDIVRASAVFETPAEITVFLNELNNSDTLSIVRLNDRMKHPQNGYRDLNLGLQLNTDPSSNTGHIAELQVHLKKIIDVKEISHVSYAIARGINTDSAEFSVPLEKESSWKLDEESATLGSSIQNIQLGEAYDDYEFHNNGLELFKKLLKLNVN